MLTILSPSKKLDFTTPVHVDAYTIADHLDSSKILVSELRTWNQDKLMAVMGISAELAQLNRTRFASWIPPTKPSSDCRQAIYGFAGDVYRGFQAYDLDAQDIEATQTGLRIISGLYGILRPLDLVAPYRLEMGTRVQLAESANLYEFWGDAILNSLKVAVQNSPGEPAVINLASSEYSKSARLPKLKSKAITPRFLNRTKSGNLQVIATFAKVARGAMAAWIVRSRASSPDDLKDFSELGYSFDPDRSSPLTPTFTAH